MYSERLCRVLVVSVCLVGAAVLAGAQETTGEIQGIITSEDGVTLPGVTVTVDNLETGLTRTLVSSQQGEYRFFALPPGRYELSATLDGFQTYRRNFDVDVGRTIRNDFAMTLGAITEVIDVTGEAPLVDVTSTVSGLTVNTEQLNARVPVGREATQIALLAPTSVSAHSSFNDATRGYTPGQNVVSIGGASAGENLYEVNGLNITNFRNMVGSTFVPFEFLEEVQVKTGGYQAEYGRSMGGVINMVTKSGTNTLRGSASVYFSPESLQEQSPDALDRQNSNEFSESLEANASLGGAIVKDRLFFFGFIRYDDTEFSEIRGARETVLRNDAPYYGGKVDWNITPSHRLEGTYLVDETDFEQDRFGWNPVERRREDSIGTGISERGGTNWIGKYTGIFGDSFLLSGQYGVNEFARSDGSNADDCHTAFDDRVTSTPIGCWVNQIVLDANDERTAYRADLDWYIGNHSIRGGFDEEDLTSTETSFYSGGNWFVYSLNPPVSEGGYEQIPVGADIVEVRTRTTGGSFDTTTTGVYLQDSWAITPAFTLNLGVRWEQYESFNTEGEAFIKIDDQYAPRIGFIWDPSGQGRQKIFGSFGQYHIPIATNTNIRLAGLEYDVFEYYAVTGQDGGLPYDPATGEPTGLGDLLEVTEVSSGVPPDVVTVVASEFDPMSQFEYILGYEQMVGDVWSFGARAVHRTYDAVIEDFTIDQALSEVYGVEGSFFNYVLGNPGSDFQGFYDLDGDGIPDPIQFTAEELAYPEAQREYYAVELTANKRFANNWTMQASYVWSQSYGNYEGYLKSEFGQDDAGLTQDFDFAALMDNTYGPLPNDRRHNFKIYGSYVWDMGLQVGGFFNYRTGRPINAMSVHPTDFWASLYQNSSFFLQDGTPAPRGSQGRTDDVYTIDAMVKYDFVLGPVDLNVRLDVFNLLDDSATVQVHEFSGTTTNAPDAGFLQPTYYQQPRTVRFGVGLNF